MPSASRFIGDKAADGSGDNGEDGQSNDGVEITAKVNKVMREMKVVVAWRKGRAANLGIL